MNGSEPPPEKKSKAIVRPASKAADRIEGPWKQVLQLIQEKKLATMIKGDLNAVWTDYDQITLLVKINRDELCRALVGSQKVLGIPKDLFQVESDVRVPWSLGDGNDVNLTCKIAKSIPKNEQVEMVRALRTTEGDYCKDVIVILPIQFKPYVDFPNAGDVGLTCQIKGEINVFGPVVKKPKEDVPPPAAEEYDDFDPDVDFFQQEVESHP